jgi:glycosyltransferase involved in cell wall biosynthesis
MLGTLGKRKNIRVAFIQPAYAKYRRPFFEKFSNYYDTTFFFIERSPPHLWDNHSQKFPSPLQLDGKKPVSHMVHPARERLSFRRLYLAKKYLDLLLLLIINNYEVIVTSISYSPQTFISLLVSKIRKRKCVLWIEEWSIIQPEPLISRLRFYLLIMLKFCVLRNVDAIVVEGTPQKKHLKNFNVPDEKIFFSNHCSLDYSRFESKNLKQKLNIGKGLVILYLGRIIERKGLDVLIKAFSVIERERNDVFLVICGDGDFRSFCEDLVGQLRIKNVFFLGTVPEEEIASYFRTADIFVLPSCSKPHQKIKVEGWGLVINEALSMGTPVVTTNVVGAARDLVKNGVNGYIVKNGDVNELYLALRMILEDEKLRKTMGSNSRRIFESFNDFDKMFEGFRRAIDYVIDPHKRVSKFK